MSDRVQVSKTPGRVIRSLLIAGSAVLLCGVVLAQTAPKPASNPAPKPVTTSIPDLSGIWDNTHQDVNLGGPVAGPPGGFIGPGGIPTFGFTMEEPSMLPAAAEKYKAARTGLARGPLDRGRDDLDPTHD